MSIIVTTKDGKRHIFPDGTVPEKIKLSLSSYVTKPPEAPSAPGPNEMTPQQMFGPEAMTRRWLRAVPYATGLAGAMLPPPFGGLAGATVGGLVGRGVERGLGGQSLDMRSPEVRMDIERGGIDQGIMQAPASAVGVGANQLISLRGWARNRAVSQGISELRSIAKAGNIRPEIEAGAKAATATRVAAADATNAEISAATGQTISAKDIANKIISDREARWGVAASPKVRAQIRKDVARRIPKVLAGHTGRLISGRSGSFDMPTSQIGKQAFDDLVRAAHTGKESGIVPRPALDMDIANTWRALIEERVPAVDALNQTTRAAIRTERPLLRMQKNQPTDEVAALRQLAREKRMEAKILAERSANPFQMYRGLPKPGHVAVPGVSIRPGTLAELGGKIGEVLGHKASKAAMFYGPRAIAAADLINQLNFNSGTMPPDTLRNE